jgi:Transcriptional regulator
MTPEIFSTDPEWPYSKAKTAVLSAASAVIREEGPRAATLKNIATKAGITEPAIFRHFEGVDGLFDGLFSAYERVYHRCSEAYASDSKGLERLRAAAFAMVDYIASSHDFAYIMVYARHVFRGYPDLRAKVSANDAQDQENVLSCIAEGIKLGEIRSDIDPVSAAVSLIGGIYITAVLWIESGFGFDLREIYKDRWDDFERMVAVKPAPKSREAKAAARERAASFFPLHPSSPSKSRGSSKKGATKTKAAAKSAKRVASKSSTKKTAAKR